MIIFEWILINKNCQGGHWYAPRFARLIFSLLLSLFFFSLLLWNENYKIKMKSNTQRKEGGVKKMALSERLACVMWSQTLRFHRSCVTVTVNFQICREYCHGLQPPSHSYIINRKFSAMNMKHANEHINIWARWPQCVLWPGRSSELYKCLCICFIPHSGALVRVEKKKRERRFFKRPPTLF